MYEKPKNMRVVDMCIYVDNTIYKPDITEEERETCYKYIVLIVFLITSKAKFFDEAWKYEDFSMYVGEYVYMRMVNPNLPHLKSVLNYIKKVHKPLKALWEKENYAHTIFYNFDYADDDRFDPAGYDFMDTIECTTEGFDEVDFLTSLEDICRLIKGFLQNIPWDPNSIEWHNIYLSCLLTFLNWITPSNFDVERYETLLNEGDRENHIANLFDKRKKDGIIIYHLPENMRDYIGVLCNEIRHTLAKSLSESIKTCVPPREMMKAIVFAEVNGNWDNEEEEWN